MGLVVKRKAYNFLGNLDFANAITPSIHPMEQELV